MHDINTRVQMWKLLKRFNIGWKPSFNIHYTAGVKLLTRLTLVLSYLNKHSYRYNYGINSNPNYFFNPENDSTFSYIAIFENSELFKKLKAVDSSLFDLADNRLAGITLYGSSFLIAVKTDLFSFDMDSERPSQCLLV